MGHGYKTLLCVVESLLRVVVCVCWLGWVGFPMCWHAGSFKSGITPKLRVGAPWFYLLTEKKKDWTYAAGDVGVG